MFVVCSEHAQFMAPTMPETPFARRFPKCKDNTLRAPQKKQLQN